MAGRSVRVGGSADDSLRADGFRGPEVHHLHRQMWLRVDLVGSPTVGADMPRLIAFACIIKPTTWIGLPATNKPSMDGEGHFVYQASNSVDRQIGDRNACRVPDPDKRRRSKYSTGLRRPCDRLEGECDSSNDLETCFLEAHGRRVRGYCLRLV